MGSLSFAEIITILLVVLIVFGPNRLPEFARKLGELMAQARRATSQFSKDISTEWGDAVEPIRAVKDDYDGVKKDLKDATAAITGFGAGETSEETTDHRPETSDRADDDQSPDPLSGGTGESASQGDDADDDGLRTTDDGAESEERSSDESSSDGQGADTELGEA
jgi:sec-independent protein translocase protein TatB